MSRTIRSLTLTAVIVCMLTGSAVFGAAIIDPRLNTGGSTAAVSAIVTYQNTPTAADVATLRTLGIQYGVAMKALPMVGVWATPAQIQQIAALSNVRSIYANRTLRYYNHEGSALVGALEQRTMPGFGYSGRGIGVAIVDSGIDGTHPDLPYPSHVKQNLKVLIGGPGLGSPFTGIVPVAYTEGLADSDTSSGHGTHASGSIAGLGTQSGGKFAGVAPGADLIGVSTGETIIILWALEGFDYVLTHQYVNNIRVVSNSWGTSGAFDPEDPVSVASKILHDRGITVVFAAGNEGAGNNTMNPYAVAPWVIGVAAGDKRGHLADFSSRGLPHDNLYHPTVTAPGVTIVSVKAPGTPLGIISTCPDGALTTAETPYYACMDGTSMATPHVAGACALILEANPSLTPDGVKALIEKTATPMAGYQRHQVGAGYLNVLAALDSIKNPSKGYGAVLNQNYNARFTGSSTVEKLDQNWSPIGAVPTHNFTVNANGEQTDVFLTWDSLANTFNLSVTDPNGVNTATGSNLLAAVYGLQASLGFSRPAAGTWQTAVYGLKGQSTGTTGVGIPDTLHLTISNYYGTFGGLDDVDQSPYAPYIRRAVTMRLMDSADMRNFAPDAPLTRGDAARVIASSCWLRQNELQESTFWDVPADLAPFVAAVTAPGAPLRDTFMTSGSVMPGGLEFQPAAAVNRADLAVWLVRALGRDAEAQANMSTATSFTDDAQIPAAARGYVVVANNIGLMTGYTNPSQIEGTPVTYSWRPAEPVTRGAMAMTIGRWYDIFMQP